MPCASGSGTARAHGALLRPCTSRPQGTPIADLMAARTPAHRRLIFEEFWYLELGLELKRRRLRERARNAVRDRTRRCAERSNKCCPSSPPQRRSACSARSSPTCASRGPCAACCRAMSAPARPSWRFQAALVAIENGYQAAVMAPTEILATQHYSRRAQAARQTSLSPHTGKPYRITLLTGSLDERSKREARARIFRGETDLAIGTHALVEEKVDFENLGLVVIDEQHRFGVQQRFQLTRKPGANGVATEPDVLVMTATPIPRTLALSVYGDLEASVIDELPPDEHPSSRGACPRTRADEVWSFVRKQVEAGRQALHRLPDDRRYQTDDQAELDFARDPECRSRRSRPDAIRPTAFRAGVEEIAARHGGHAAAKRVTQAAGLPAPRRR